MFAERRVPCLRHRTLGKTYVSIASAIHYSYGGAVGIGGLLERRVATLVAGGPKEQAISGSLTRTPSRAQSLPDRKSSECLSYSSPSRNPGPIYSVSNSRVLCTE